MMKRLFLTIFIFSSLLLKAQFAPPAGQEGSTAIPYDSDVFVEWANGCVVERGWVDIADTTLGKTSYGEAADGEGQADNIVVSLGDGGTAILTFNHPVVNGEGWDFAVFENAFDDQFLELAFVEVSSDGENFFRFPSVSLTPDDEQVPTFGTVDATKINNLAGKYRVLYGTPFDLEELINQEGLDVNNIIAIKVVDVIGSVDDNFATYDSQGHKVNDPWPTAFNTGGFDLDAVGVINNTSNSGITGKDENKIKVYPNPADKMIYLQDDVSSVEVCDISGKVLIEKKEVNRIDISGCNPGMLLVKVKYKNGTINRVKIIKR